MKVLVLAGGVPQIKLINELKKRGYVTVLADYFENPVAKEYADIFYQESTLDVEAIRRIALREKVDFIITCCTDQAVLTMSRLSEELKLPCYVSSDIGMWVTNKAYMKAKFKDAGIPTAGFVVVSEPEFECELTYPLVVKPVDCNSSKGVVKVNNDTELKMAVANALEYSRSKRAIVEEFICGEELSIDLFVKDKKARVLCVSTSDKIKDDNRFVIWRGVYKRGISKGILGKIEEISQRIVDAFELSDCPMLIQMLCKDDELYVVEFSARTGGGIKYHMIELVSGVDVISATVDLMENKKNTINETIIDNGLVINEFIYCNEGVFKDFSGFEECVEEGLLESYYLLKSKGSLVGGNRNSGDRVIAMTYLADTYADYVNKHNDVVLKVKILDEENKDIINRNIFTQI